MNRCVVWALLVVIGPASALAQDKTGGGFDPAKAMAEMQRQFLQQFDVDRDGKLSAQENMMAQEAMRRQGINMGIAPGGFPGADQFARQFDRDGDGKLNPMEAAAAQAAFQRMRNNGSGPRGGGGGGSALPQQPMAPTTPPPETKPAKVSPLVKRFDKDGDGKLNAEEKAAAQAEFKKEKGKDAKPKNEEKAKEAEAGVKDVGKAKEKDGKAKEKPAKKAGK